MSELVLLMKDSLESSSFFIQLCGSSFLLREETLLIILAGKAPMP